LRDIGGRKMRMPGYAGHRQSTTAVLSEGGQIDNNDS